ncbi:hypothetical protein C0992_011406, partial [Termitomyces sp. T32_za158]
PGNPPGDTTNDDVFEDWIDRLHGFMHLLQLPTRLLRADRPLNTLLHPIKPYRPTPFQPQLTFFTKSLTDTYTQNLPTDLKRIEEPKQLRDSSTDLAYNAVLRSAKAQAMDRRLELIKLWLDNLKQPDNLTDGQYSNFIRQATQYFLTDHKLWRRNRDGAHKIATEDSMLPAQPLPNVSGGPTSAPT